MDAQSFEPQGRRFTNAIIIIINVKTIHPDDCSSSVLKTPGCDREDGVRNNLLIYCTETGQCLLDARISFKILISIYRMAVTPVQNLKTK